MNHWKIKPTHPDAPPGFPFAIVNFKDEVVAWVKTKKDAEFIKKADPHISRLEGDSTRYKRLYAGQMISRRK
jgi:hypothetical protein